MENINPRITAFIVGAGAVDGAWAPILKALQPYHDFPLTPDGANSYLARLVYLLRWWSTNPSEIASKEFNVVKRHLITVRAEIAKSLRVAVKKGQLKVRPEFEEIVRKRVLAEPGSIMLITTNWDNVIGVALKSLLNTKQTKFQPIPLHIHGSMNTPNLLYLPSEMTKEPYRNMDEEQLIGGIHGSIWRGLERCHRAVVYGLSISPLDAELGQILACGWSNKILKEIEVIAPDHELVAGRVNLLLDRKRDVSVFGFSPLDLNNSFDYSIRRVN